MIKKASFADMPLELKLLRHNYLSDCPEKKLSNRLGSIDFSEKFYNDEMLGINNFHMASNIGKMFSDIEDESLSTIAIEFNLFGQDSEIEIINRVEGITGKGVLFGNGVSEVHLKSWALAAFSCLTKAAYKYAERGEIDEAIIVSRRAGRIEEWWRWRRLGLDRDALAKRLERDANQANAKLAGERARETMEKRRRAWFKHLNHCAQRRSWLLLSDRRKLQEARISFQRVMEGNTDLGSLFRRLKPAWFERAFSDWQSQAAEEKG